MGKIEINDLVYFKDIKIVQNKDYFNFSLDSVLLPNFVEITKKTSKILDMCTGNAPIPLILSTKTIKINKLENQIKLINDNIKNLKKFFNTETFDIITCNPPYFKKKDGSIINENKVKSIARHEIEMELEDVMIISKALLKNEGSLVLVHRTERLIEIIELMKKHNIEPKRMRLIYPKVNTESNLVLIDGRKNGKDGLKILPPLYIHNEDNSYTKEVLEMFGK